MAEKHIEYQDKVVADISEYAKLATQYQPMDAFREFWLKRNVIPDDLFGGYNDTVPGVSRVTVKVPTAGGKTFIACKSLRPIMDTMPSGKPQVVVWFVPSDTILTQTYQNLSNEQHFYRQYINSQFNNRVQVVDKESALMGTNISPNDLPYQLTIFVLSVQSFIEGTKGGTLPKAYRQNSNLADHIPTYRYKDKLIKDVDESALIQVIAQLNPVVIIDESHNFTSELRSDLLNLINPSLILELTATPRPSSNIISYVDAAQLKAANMVKLPVVAYNQQDSNFVISSAYQLRQKLESLAIEEEEQGGKYIRPIVLFQAQPKTEEDSETFEYIKKKLVEKGIPEEQIKIKTANKNELVGINLMSKDCPVRYIITVNALKEGWDCPFAYILASLANRTSEVDVEQIIGRILRQPHTTKHSSELLNLCYVFTSSADFKQTVEHIIKGLNNAGFTDKDFRAENNVQEPGPEPEPQQPETGYKNTLDVSVFATSESSEPLPNETTLSVAAVDIPSTASEEPADFLNNLSGVDLSSASTQNVEELALQMAQDYERSTVKDNNNIAKNNLPHELATKITSYGIKKEFVVQDQLPQFFFVKSPVEFPDAKVGLTTNKLEKDFNLQKEDSNISFEQTSIQAVKLDVNERNTPQQQAVQAGYWINFKKLISSLAPEKQREKFAEAIAKNLKYNSIGHRNLLDFIKVAISDKNEDEISELIAFEFNTVNAFKKKIDSLLMKHRLDKFRDWLLTGEIVCEPNYKFPEEITWLHPAKIDIAKSLYTKEEDVNGWEYKVISALVNLDNILFWHRNPQNTGYCINGFINHYPDFILKTKSGKYLIVEPKGDHLDNDDSKNKRLLGKELVSEANKMAGETKYYYFMVFENKNVDGAFSLEECMSIVKKL